MPITDGRRSMRMESAMCNSDHQGRHPLGRPVAAGPITRPSFPFSRSLFFYSYFSLLSFHYPNPQETRAVLQRHETRPTLLTGIAPLTINSRGRAAPERGARKEGGGLHLRRRGESASGGHPPADHPSTRPPARCPTGMAGADADPTFSIARRIFPRPHGMIPGFARHGPG